MSFIEVGGIYIKTEKLIGVSDVEEMPAPIGGEANYSFSIFLEGAKTGVVTNDGAQAKAMHDKVEGKMSPEFRFASGGMTLWYPAVNSIGIVTSEPTSENPKAAGFLVQMDGVSPNLEYPDTEKAEEGRNALIKKVTSFKSE